MEKQRVEIPKKKSDILREMKPGDSIDITNQNRNAWYVQARYAVPGATWRTVTVDGKVYLNRVS